MALADTLTKARVRLALARDPGVSAEAITVLCDHGCVTLTGDLPNAERCASITTLIQTVPGVSEVRNQCTCGQEKVAGSAAEVSQRFLEKLEAAWQSLPEKTALAQADYLRWALWMVHKFHIPPNLAGGDSELLEAATVERALDQLSEQTAVPRAILALELLREVELINATEGVEHPPAAPDAPVSTAASEAGSATTARAAKPA